MYNRILFFSLFAYSLSIFAMESPTTQTVQIKNHTVLRGELKEREDDLTDNDWAEVINAIASKLHAIHLPDINVQSIEKFRRDMFQHKPSLANLRKALNDNFGIGHMSVVREKFDENAGLFLVGKQDKSKAQFEIIPIVSTEGKSFGFLVDSPSPITTEDINNYMYNSKKITIKFLQSSKGEVLIVTVPTFNTDHISKLTLLSDIKSMAQKIDKKYENIILDLRGNGGGNIYVLYYFLSLLLGNNDPDIYIIPVSINGQSDQNYHRHLEEQANNTKLNPFYEFHKFEPPVANFLIKKHIEEDITFKKMIILVDEGTGSAAEIAAATLKNTLGSKICIIGKPCGGSFERDGGKIQLPHDFILALPQGGQLFYSKKYKKLLSGYRLLPDIRYDNMNTIMDKALQMINESTSCSEDPSYERTMKH